MFFWEGGNIRNGLKIMFSPKMQRPVRVNEVGQVINVDVFEISKKCKLNNQLMSFQVQLHTLAERARYDATIAGALYKRTSDGSKWQLRWFTLYQVGR